MSDTHSLRRKKGISLKNLMQMVTEGRADEDTLQSLAYSISRLDNRLDESGREKLKKYPESASPILINKILDGIDIDKQIEYAKEKFQTQDPYTATDCRCRKRISTKCL